MTRSYWQFAPAALATLGLMATTVYGQQGQGSGQPGNQSGQGGAQVEIQPGTQPGVQIRQPGAQPNAQPGQPGVQPRDPAAQPGTQPRQQDVQPGRQPDQLNRQQPGMREGAQRGGQAQGVDAHLVVWMLTDNRNEIALSQLAVERAESGKVKEFAQRMIEDHKQMDQRLRALTSNQPAAGARPDAAANRQFDPNRADRDQDQDLNRLQNQDRNAIQNQDPNPVRDRDPNQQDRDLQDQARQDADRDRANRQDPNAQRQQDQFARQPAMQGGRNVGYQLTTIKREMGEQCLQSARAELEGKQGREFDQCFVFMQIGSHQHMLDAIDVFQRHATGELRQILQEARPIVESHLQHAKQLAEEFDSQTQTREPASE